MDEHQGASGVFVIRIWHEWTLTERRWYGRIENLRTNQVLTFRDPAQILPFLTNAAGLASQEEVNKLPSLTDDLDD